MRSATTSENQFSLAYITARIDAPTTMSDADAESLTEEIDAIQSEVADFIRSRIKKLDLRLSVHLNI